MTKRSAGPAASGLPRDADRVWLIGPVGLVARMRCNKLFFAGAGMFGALVLALPASPAVAATTTATIAISATVQATCVVSAAPLAFGTYTGVQLDATAIISVTCTNTTTYTVGLDKGTTASGTVAARLMVGPAAATLGYRLASASQAGANWGDTLPLGWVTGTGNGSLQPLTVYGRVAAGQYVAPGAYTDTITATVTY
jgi:spore coat protein U-like protein